MSLPHRDLNGGIESPEHAYYGSPKKPQPRRTGQGTSAGAMAVDIFDGARMNAERQQGTPIRGRNPQDLTSAPDAYYANAKKLPAAQPPRVVPRNSKGGTASPHITLIHLPVDAWQHAIVTAAAADQNRTIIRVPQGQEEALVTLCDYLVSEAEIPEGWAIVRPVNAPNCPETITEHEQPPAAVHTTPKPVVAPVAAPHKGPEPVKPVATKPAPAPAPHVAPTVSKIESEVAKHATATVPVGGTTEHTTAEHTHTEEKSETDDHGKVKEVHEEPKNEDLNHEDLDNQ